MPIQATRRNFLTLAGAAIGSLATSARALAQERRGSGVPELDRDVPSRAFGHLALATIVGPAGANLEVEVEDSRVRHRLPSRHFGDWAHQVGDRVVVVESPSGRRSIQPYVRAVDARLPNWPSRVAVGEVIEVGEHSARIGSESVKKMYEALQAKSTGEAVHWLLVENVHTRELRVFGVMDSHVK